MNPQTKGDYAQKPTFTPISNAFLDSDIFLELDHPSWKVLTILLRYSDAGLKPVWPSIRLISTRAKMSASTVQMKIKTLCEMGIIHKDSESSRSNKYYFNRDIVPPIGTPYKPTMYRETAQRTENQHTVYRESSHDVPGDDTEVYRETAPIHTNNPNKLTTPTNQKSVVVVSEDIIKMIELLGINIDKIKEVLEYAKENGRDSTYVWKLLKHIDEMKETGDPIKKPIPFMRKAIEEGWDIVVSKKRKAPWLKNIECLHWVKENDPKALEKLKEIALVEHPYTPGNDARKPIRVNYLAQLCEKHYKKHYFEIMEKAR